MNTAAALDTLAELGVFEKMPREGSITAKELGALTNTEPSVIGILSLTYPYQTQKNKLIATPVRFMRMLTGTGIIVSTGIDTYAHTPKSLAYLQESALDFFNLWYRLSDHLPFCELSLHPTAPI